MSTSTTSATRTTPASGTDHAADSEKMIHPYGEIVEASKSEFARIGFSKTKETDYTVTLSNGEYSVGIVTERYYHPSLTSHVIDKDGNSYSVWVLREILEPAKNHKDICALDEISKEFHLDDSHASKELRALGTYAHVSLSVKQLIEFLESNNEALATGTFKEQYAVKSKGR